MWFFFCLHTRLEIVRCLVWTKKYFGILDNLCIARKIVSWFGGRQKGSVFVKSNSSQFVKCLIFLAYQKRTLRV
jgi:hypothetical protein